jgi:hypothetical protein
MWGRSGWRGSRRSEGVKSRFAALGNPRGRSGRRKPEQERLIYGGAVGLGVAALAVVAAISLLLLMRRRSRGGANSTEDVHKEVNTENGESTV